MIGVQSWWFSSPWNNVRISVCMHMHLCVVSMYTKKQKNSVTKSCHVWLTYIHTYKTYMYMCIYAHTHIYTRIYTNSCMYISIYAHMHSYIHVYSTGTNNEMVLPFYEYMHACIYQYMHICIRTFMYTGATTDRSSSLYNWWYGLVEPWAKYVCLGFFQGMYACIYVGICSCQCMCVFLYVCVRLCVCICM